MVPGSIVLIGGDPGIGKSTLLLQVALEMAQQSPVLYVSGEESERQIKMRAAAPADATADGDGSENRVATSPKTCSWSPRPTWS